MNPEDTVPIGADETVDEMFAGKLRLIQKRAGYRFSMDAVLLARLASIGKGNRVIDIGTGCGVIPLILALCGQAREIVGVEIQQDLADMANRNVLLNGFAAGISILHRDARDLTAGFASGTFDCVISNPPFRKIKTGRRPAAREKAVARHEVTLSLEQLLAVALHLLKVQGRFFVIYPAFRAVDLFAAMREKGIEPKAIQWIHGRVDLPAKLVMVEGVKGGGVDLEVKEPLVLYDQEGTYTPALRGIYFLP